MVVAHPDDACFTAGGSIAKWTNEGAKVYFLILTNGNKGSDDYKMTSEKLIKIRRSEQEAAAKVLGVRQVFFLNYNDCELEPTMAVKRDVVKIIRQVKPDTVITFDPQNRYSPDRGFINHPDHIAAGEATLAAVYPAARDRLTFPNLGGKPHKVGQVLLVNFEETNFFVDITATFEKKLQALKCHPSQIGNFVEVKKMVTDWARVAGKKAKVKYAEGFKRILISS